MTFIDFDEIERTKEAIIAPEGAYDVTIRHAEVDHKDDGRENIVLTLGIEGRSDEGEEFQIFRHWLSLPNEMDDDSKVETKKRMLKRFFKLSGYTPSSASLSTEEVAEEIIGLQFQGQVFQEMYEPPGKDPIQNNRLRVPRAV